MDIWDKPNILHKTSVVKIISSKLAAVYNNEWFAQISTVQTKLLGLIVHFKHSSIRKTMLHVKS